RARAMRRGTQVERRPGARCFRVFKDGPPVVSLGELEVNRRVINALLDVEEGVTVLLLANTGAVLFEKRQRAREFFLRRRVVALREKAKESPFVRAVAQGRQAAGLFERRVAPGVGARQGFGRIHITEGLIVIAQCLIPIARLTAQVTQFERGVGAAEWVGRGPQAKL